MNKKIETKKELKEHDLHAIKRFGQNFLINQDIINRIVDSANVSEETGVLEIGPGLGSITSLLVTKVKKLVAVEIDKKLISILNDKIQSKNFVLINDDFLNIDLKELVNKYFSDCKEIIVVANLPYYISGKIITKILKSDLFERTIIMLQKELAIRLQAKPKTRDYNDFTVVTDFFTTKKILFDVNRTNFIPAPKVTSSIIEFTRKNHEELNIEKFAKFARLCFHMKRKKLTNNLLKSYNKEKINDFMASKKLDPNIRPEEIDLSMYIDFYKFFEGK